MRKIILTHQGALGDFLLAWPGLLAVIRQAEGPVCWTGPPGRLPLLAPLGVTPADRDTRQAVAACYTATELTGLPAPLAGARLFWFGLERNPLPEAVARDPRVCFVPILEGETPPAVTVAARLREHGIPVPENALTTFKTLFGPPALQGDGAPVLLFPGSGHPRKCWPLERFRTLASSLEEAGRPTLFVLGPDEVEQGWRKRIDGFAVQTPDSLPELLETLRSAAAVVGNDSGPMHLAGMLGLPGVAVFGPTSERQWGPPGLAILTGEVPCRPCTRTTRGLDCPRALCLEAVPVERVLAALKRQGD